MEVLFVRDHGLGKYTLTSPAQVLTLSLQLRAGPTVLQALERIQQQLEEQRKVLQVLQEQNRTLQAKQVLWIIQFHLQATVRSFRITGATTRINACRGRVIVSGKGDEGLLYFV
jgi:hypothetical protein